MLKQLKHDLAHSISHNDDDSIDIKAQQQVRSESVTKDQKNLADEKLNKLRQQI